MAGTRLRKSTEDGLSTEYASKNTLTKQSEVLNAYGNMMNSRKMLH